MNKLYRWVGWLISDEALFELGTVGLVLIICLLLLSSYLFG